MVRRPDADRQLLIFIMYGKSKNHNLILNNCLFWEIHFKVKPRTKLHRPSYRAKSMLHIPTQGRANWGGGGKWGLRPGCQKPNIFSFSNESRKVIKFTRVEYFTSDFEH